MEDITLQAKMKKEYEELQLKLVKLVSLEGALTAGVRELEEEPRKKGNRNTFRVEEEDQTGQNFPLESGPAATQL